MDRAVQMWIFLALFAGFAIKVPLFPLHTWLPLAHVAGTDGGQRDPGGRAAEDRHLRLRAVQLADAARRRGRAHAVDAVDLAWPASSTGPWSRWRKATSSG